MRYLVAGSIVLSALIMTFGRDVAAYVETFNEPTMSNQECIQAWVEFGSYLNRLKEHGNQHTR